MRDWLLGTTLRATVFAVPFFSLAHLLKGQESMITITLPAWFAWVMVIAAIVIIAMGIESAIARRKELKSRQDLIAQMKAGKVKSILADD